MLLNWLEDRWANIIANYIRRYFDEIYLFGDIARNFFRHGSELKSKEFEEK